MKLEQYFFVKNLKRDKLENVLQIMANYFHKTELTRDILVFTSTEEENAYIIYFKNEPDFTHFKQFFYFFSKIALIHKKADVRAYWDMDQEDILDNNDLQEYVGTRFMLLSFPRRNTSKMLYGVNKYNQVYSITLNEPYTIEKVSNQSIQYNELSDHYIKNFTLAFTINSSTEPVKFKGGCSKVSIMVIASLVVSLIVGLLVFFLAQAE